MHAPLRWASSSLQPPGAQDRPEAALFKRLANMAPRELPVEPLRPGRYIVAVYGDNWCADRRLDGPPAWC